MVFIHPENYLENSDKNGKKFTISRWEMIICQSFCFYVDKMRMGILSYLDNHLKTILHLYKYYDKL